VVAAGRPAASLARGPARPSGALVRAHATGREGAALSTRPAGYDGDSASPIEESRSGESVAGFLAAGSIALSFVAIVEKPVRLAPFALVVAFIAVAIGGRHERLASAAVVIGIFGFIVGMTIAVATENPLF
jgi:hypothetical protein